MNNKKNSQLKPGFQQIKTMLVLSLVLVLSANTWAWDAVGHRIIGEIAYQNLTKNACLDTRVLPTASLCQTGG